MSYQDLYQSIVADVAAQRKAGAQAMRDKLSSADAGQAVTFVTEHERLRQKASAVHSRNQDIIKIAQIVHRVGVTGIEKLAADSIGAGSSPGGDVGGGDYATPLTTPMEGVGETTDDGREDPVAEHTLKQTLMSGEAPDKGDMSGNPVVTRTARGGQGYQLDQGNLSSAEAPAGGPNVTFPGDTAKNLATRGDTEAFDKASAGMGLNTMFQSRAGGKVPGVKYDDTSKVPEGATYYDSKGNKKTKKKTAPPKPKTPKTSSAHVIASLMRDKELVDSGAAWNALSRMNIHSADDARYVLKQSAIRYGYQGQDEGALVGNMISGMHLGNLEMPELWRAALYTEKRSQPGANPEGEIGKAKEVVEGVVKATAELPTADQVAQAAGVSTTAANVAIYDTGELIAAVGGQVAAPGQAMQAAPAPVPPGMMPPGAGGMPIPMGGAPGAPMPAPPMDPNAMGGAPAAPPAAPAAPPAPAPAGGMPVQSSATPVHPRRLFDAIAAVNRYGHFKLSEEPTIDVKDEPLLGGRQDSEMVVDPSGYSASNSIENNERKVTTADFLDDKDRALLSSTLGSNSAQVTTGPEDTDQRQGEPTHLTHEIKLPSTDGIIDGMGAQVAGTGHQDMADSSMKTSSFKQGLNELSTDLFLTMFPNMRKASMEDERVEVSKEIAPKTDDDEHKEGGDYQNADGSEGEKVNDTTTTAMGSDTSDSVFASGNM